jgi:hypothetical protein
LFGPDGFIPIWGNPGYNPPGIGGKFDFWLAGAGGLWDMPWWGPLRGPHIPSMLDDLTDPTAGEAGERPSIPSLGSLASGPPVITGGPPSWKDRMPRLMGASSGGGLLSRIGRRIKGLIGKVGRTVKGLFSKAKKAVRRTVASISATAKKVYARVSGGIKKGIESAKRFFKGAERKIYELAQNAIRTIREIVPAYLELARIYHKLFIADLNYKTEMLRAFWNDPNVAWYEKLGPLDIFIWGAMNTLRSIIHTRTFWDTEWPAWATHCGKISERLFSKVGDNWKYWDVGIQSLPYGAHKWISIRPKNPVHRFFNPGYNVDPWLIPGIAPIQGKGSVGYFTDPIFDN